MNTMIALCSAWIAITLVFVVLLLYRRSLVKKESDWIPLTDDAKEASAIQAQTVIEMKTNKLTVPIRTLGTLSLVMLLVIVGFWLFKRFSLRPPCRSKLTREYGRERAQPATAVAPSPAISPARWCAAASLSDAVPRLATFTATSRNQVRADPMQISQNVDRIATARPMAIPPSAQERV